MPDKGLVAGSFVVLDVGNIGKECPCRPTEFLLFLFHFPSSFLSEVHAAFPFAPRRFNSRRAIFRWSRKSIFKAVPTGPQSPRETSARFSSMRRINSRSFVGDFS